MPLVSPSAPRPHTLHMCSVTVTVDVVAAATAAAKIPFPLPALLYLLDALLGSNRPLTRTANNDNCRHRHRIVYLAHMMVHG